MIGRFGNRIENAQANCRLRVFFMFVKDRFRAPVFLKQLVYPAKSVKVR